eukprot:CAMPEP_0115037624 /NCGR_PEP_ID=MMETSP0216-20121206/42920_1 /TAXON_ID=223996 /ORGANISM="Protocruzia adherens, Strain Boccale" /LENGTH=152 /DNA_ID=CAMNT_0002417861 /DNA_START=9 /DNA_END=463 /DNA_ORIENTATION=-
MKMGHVKSSRVADVQLGTIAAVPDSAVYVMLLVLTSSGDCVTCSETDQKLFVGTRGGYQDGQCQTVTGSDCPEGYYPSSSSVCTACDTNCATCNLETTTCTSCEQGQWLLNGSTQDFADATCQTSCPPGFAPESSTACALCSAACKECVGLS